MTQPHPTTSPHPDAKRDAALADPSAGRAGNASERRDEDGFECDWDGDRASLSDTFTVWWDKGARWIVIFRGGQILVGESPRLTSPATQTSWAELRSQAATSDRGEGVALPGVEEAIQSYGEACKTYDRVMRDGSAPVGDAYRRMELAYNAAVDAARLAARGTAPEGASSSDLPPIAEARALLTDTQIARAHRIASVALPQKADGDYAVTFGVAVQGMAAIVREAAPAAGDGLRAAVPPGVRCFAEDMAKSIRGLLKWHPEYDCLRVSGKANDGTAFCRADMMLVALDVLASAAGGGGADRWRPIETCLTAGPIWAGWDGSNLARPKVSDEEAEGIACWVASYPNSAPTHWCPRQPKPAPPTTPGAAS